jgi:hypothetical protein
MGELVDRDDDDADGDFDDAHHDEEFDEGEAGCTGRGVLAAA